MTYEGEWHYVAENYVTTTGNASSQSQKNHNVAQLVEQRNINP